MSTPITDQTAGGGGEALQTLLASLVAAVSLLERGGKKAAASDRMFEIMLADYRKAIEVGRTALAAPTGPEKAEPVAWEDPLVAYLERQWSWSKETFGPALRTKGIVQHITKELREIEADPHDLAEWVDVIILAMDGFWRHGGKPADLLPAMQAKQDRNFARTWPDWRTMGEDQAIEHDRSGEGPPAGDAGAEPEGRPASKIIAGLKDAVAFAQGDTSRGRIIHPTPAEPPASPAGGEDLEGLSARATPDQIEYLEVLQASLQSSAQIDRETRIGPAGPAAGFDGYGSQARPLAAPDAAASHHTNFKTIPAASRPDEQGEPVAWAFEYAMTTDTIFTDWLRGVEFEKPSGSQFLKLRDVRPLYAHPAPAASRPAVGREEILDTLAMILPMAKGYAAAHPVGANQSKCDHADALLDAYRGEPDGWLPIETAPKDGTRILVEFDREVGVHAVAWEESVSGIECWAVDDNKHGPYALRGYMEGVRWRPLPNPPASPGQTTEER